MDDELTFGQWLQRRRKALHLTQQQLGDLARCAAETIRKYEADSRRPSPDVLDYLAAALQIPEHERAAFTHFAEGDLVDLPVAVPPAAGSTSRPLHAPSNLPVPLTPLIGRERDVATVAALLERSEVRLVTLTGPGGVGKTRLSIAVAGALRDAFVDGCFFVDLAPLSDPDLVLATVAQALSVKENGGTPLLATVQAHLRERQVLLVLDNFEQVLAAGLVMAELLQAAPRLNVLVTSRIPLHVRGEREFAVEPLGLPGVGVVDAAALSQYDAVRLFIERAQSVKADFQVTNANAPAVAEICARLDGLPLALELAAARVKLLPPEALLQRLSSRLKTLTGGARDLPTRQQTLRTTIAWSYDLLNPAEQALFTRLAVFAGGWTLEAAEVVCTAEGDLPGAVLDGLHSLYDKSLVQQQARSEGAPRFMMLETIREYALERLAASGEAEQVRQDHASYYVALVLPSDRAHDGVNTAEWLAWLDADHDNLRAVLLWAMTHDVPLAVEMAASLKDFWYIRGYWSEGQRWIEALLPLSTQVDAALRSRAWDCAGVLAGLLGDPVARSRFEQALVHAREAGYVPGVAFALRNIGMELEQQGDRTQAFALYQESLEVYKQLGHQQGIGIVLHTLGCAWAAEDPARAEAYHRESLAMFRTIGDEQLVPIALANLAEITLERGDAAQAREYAEECLAFARKLDSPELIVEALLMLGASGRMAGDRERAAAYYGESLQRAHSWGDARWMAKALDGVVLLRLEGDETSGARTRAARLAGAAEALRERIALPRAAAELVEHERVIAALGARADEGEFWAAWAEGRATTLEQAIADGLGEGSEDKRGH